MTAWQFLAPFSSLLPTSLRNDVRLLPPRLDASGRWCRTAWFQDGSGEVETVLCGLIAFGIRSATSIAMIACQNGFVHRDFFVCDPSSVQRRRSVFTSGPSARTVRRECGDQARIIKYVFFSGEDENDLRRGFSVTGPSNSKFVRSKSSTAARARVAVLRALGSGGCTDPVGERDRGEWYIVSAEPASCLRNLILVSLLCPTP